MSKKNKPRKFYAVKVGRVPGIYRSWKACKEQVHGFSQAEFKSFNNREQAEKFMLVGFNLLDRKRKSKKVKQETDYPEIKERNNPKVVYSYYCVRKRKNTGKKLSDVCRPAFTQQHEYNAPPRINIDIECEDWWPIDFKSIRKA